MIERIASLHFLVSFNKISLELFSEVKAFPTIYTFVIASSNKKYRCRCFRDI